MNVGALFGLAYNLLREERNQYYRFWASLGALAILGWVFVYILHRFRRVPFDFGVSPPRSALAAAVKIGIPVVVGLVLGWALWNGLGWWSWGDYGVGMRWSGELAVCLLGCIGWSVVVRQVCRRLGGWA